jgi:hypothetical protein
MVYSLHIGINKYSESEYGEGANLTQCVRDAYALAEIARTKFNSSNARVLIDEFCTLANIKHELTKFAHLMNANDVLLYTHSGHGTYHDYEGTRATGAYRWRIGTSAFRTAQPIANTVIRLNGYPTSGTFTDFFRISGDRYIQADGKRWLIKQQPANK